MFNIILCPLLPLLCFPVLEAGHWDGTVGLLHLGNTHVIETSCGNIFMRYK